MALQRNGVQLRHIDTSQETFALNVRMFAIIAYTIK